MLKQVTAAAVPQQEVTRVLSAKSLELSSKQEEERLSSFLHECSCRPTLCSCTHGKCVDSEYTPDLDLGASTRGASVQQIARAELERARLDVRGEALRKAAARLEELASGASLALTAADASLMQIDRDYTKLHAEVRGWTESSRPLRRRCVASQSDRVWTVPGGSGRSSVSESKS